MKKLFYSGIIGLALFEVLNVYFIMPMPGGSQEVNSLGLAYFLYRWRWLFRGLFLLLIILGARQAFQNAKWMPLLCLAALGALTYLINFKMAADSMFHQPSALRMKPASQNVVKPEKLVIGIAHQGEARAYPIQFIGYHHQVRDSIGGRPIMVTYCTVCRTGRVFEPIVQGRPESFRLVGMDHYNAMFEDKTTGSWWQQATGTAAAGPLKGTQLPELPSMQTSLAKWMELHPNTLIMQPDAAFQPKYDSMATYERGKRTGRLTRRDTASWKDKSWVVGIALGGESKAFDWNRLQQQRIIHDQVGGKPLLIALSRDSVSFVVLERVSLDQTFTLLNDTLLSPAGRYTFFGKAIDTGYADLKPLTGYQEYWHSWKTFHPLTGVGR
jgi:hypothetical protein